MKLRVFPLVLLAGFAAIGSLWIAHRRSVAEAKSPPAVRKGLGRISSLGCAGIEYLDILSGRAAFSLYRITKPWDHAAGALMMAEAGGGAVRFDGAPYGPAQPINSGIISAASQPTLSQVRAIFETVRMPLLAGLGA